MALAVDGSDEATCHSRALRGARYVWLTSCLAALRMVSTGPTHGSGTCCKLKYGIHPAYTDRILTGVAPLES